MRALEGMMMLMRVFVSEDDRYNGEPLYVAVLNMLKREGIAGATVLRGVMGYGAHSIIHGIERSTHGPDMPVCIEVVDSEEHIDRILPKLDSMVQEGLITMEKVKVIKYAPI